MTEADWLGSDEPQVMLDFIAGRLSDRALRFFACACCRDVWHLIDDDRSRTAVEMAEKYLDGVRSAELLEEAKDSAWSAARESRPRVPARFAAAQAARSPAIDAARLAALAALEGAADELEDLHSLVDDSGRRSAKARQAALLRDVVGPFPWRPVEIEPAWFVWQNGAVLAFAGSTDRERAFKNMPVLGDMLEEAGCAGREILDHCRADAPHARGCWVLELLLGRR